MTPAAAAERYRSVLLGASAAVFGFTIVEMVLIGHFESWTQWVPTLASALGLGAVAAVRFAPRPHVLVAARGTLLLVGASAFWGAYAHLSANLALELEVRPGASVRDVWWDALGGGVPTLASGVLLLGAALALAATLWREPHLPLVATRTPRPRRGG